MSKRTCPECKNKLYRSHSRGVTEQVIKTISPLRTYRCHECGWRGWIAIKSRKNPNPLFTRKVLSVVVIVVGTILVTILAVYFSSDR